MKNRLEYLLNALYYSEWKIWSDMTVKGTKTIFCLYDIPDARQKLDRVIKDARNYRNGGSFCIFEYLFIKMWGFFIFPLSLWPLPVLEIITTSTISSIGALACGGACFVPLYRYVLNHDRYIRHFKRFERRNKTWHIKWRIIAVVFWISSYITLFVGAKGVLYIDKLLRQ